MLLANITDMLIKFQSIIYEYNLSKLHISIVSVTLLQPYMIGWSDSSASGSAYGQKGSPYCTTWEWSRYQYSCSRCKKDNEAITHIPLVHLMYISIPAIILIFSSGWYSVDYCNEERTDWYCKTTSWSWSW